MPGVDLADDAEDLLFRHVFEEIGFRAGLDGPIDVLVGIIRGVDDDAGIGIFRSDRKDGLDTAQSGKAQIHQHDVRAMLEEHFQTIASIARFGDDLHVRLACDESTHAGAERGMIINNQNANGSGFHADFSVRFG